MQMKPALKVCPHREKHYQGNMRQCGQRLREREVLVYYFGNQCTVSFKKKKIELPYCLAMKLKYVPKDIKVNIARHFYISVCLAGLFPTARK